MDRAVYMKAIGLVAIAALLLGLASSVMAHGVDDGTRDFLTRNADLALGPFVYIGAKHMVTGYDHVLFLFGVLFLLSRRSDVLIYVTLFTVGHSTTLLLGVLADISANPYLVDAVIGLSVIYKGFDNLGGFEATLGRRPNPKALVLLFGLIHGLGLATKLQAFDLPRDHLLGNLIAFNAGVELGQVLALLGVLAVLGGLRSTGRLKRLTRPVNTALMTAGVALMVYQLTGYGVTQP